LIGGLLEICKENGITCGAIVCGLGTLDGAVVLTAAPAPGTKSGVGYSEPIIVKGMIEFICGQGIIMEKEGDLFIHFHGLFMDEGGKFYGGHFNPGGNPVLSTIDVVITEAAGVKALRMLDKELDLEVMFPQKC
jgi:predicted DNA-binding protein with PD1-like motif